MKQQKDTHKEKTCTYYFPSHMISNRKKKNHLKTYAKKNRIFIHKDLLQQKSMIDDEDDVFKDPAEHYPFIRLLIRYSILLLLLFLALALPAFTFYVMSIQFNQSSTLGTILGLFVFVLYLYVLWKKELWNLIQR